MSNTTSDNRGSGQRRRRSRGGRNRNRNRSNQDNRPQGEKRQGGNRQGGNRQGGERRRTRQPKPKPLTWWQKLLKAIGLYKEPTPAKGGSKGAPKSNTRNARTGEAAPKKERKPREPREPRERREDRGPVSTGDVTTKRVYLGNLSYEATESDLEELFRGVGTVRRVEIVYNRRTHRSKGYGFVEMLNVDEAKRAVEILHDQFFMGRKLNVSGAKSDGPADGGSDDDDATADEPAPTPEESQPPAEPKDENGTKPE